MRSTSFFIATVIVLGTLSACTTSRPYVATSHTDWENVAPTSEVVYKVFLYGDGGYATLDPLEPTLRLLQTRLAQADSNTAVVFLGDNIYCCGLPRAGAAHRNEYERRLRAQLSIVEDFAGRVVFIPGNHDWNDSRPGGLEAVDRQERFVENTLARGNTFLPDEGFPGPAEVELTDRLTMLAIDTEWWLHEFNKSYGETDSYDLDEDANFLLELDDMIKRNDDKDLLVVGHHPVFTNGSHAGIVPMADHIFPLRRLHPALMVPLPIIGSIYPLYVRFNGGRQNIFHARYGVLRKALRQIFNQHEDLIYAAGHDHSLQYFAFNFLPTRNRQHHIISGAGSKPSPVGRGRGAIFTAGNVEGFSVLNYYDDGSVWVEMWEAVDEGASGTLLFRTEVKGPARELVDPRTSPLPDSVDFSDSTATVAANAAYQAGGMKTLFFGNHHRDTWATPVEVPLFDVGREAGGLTVGKRGGGMQTTSLRLADKQGREYVLRSIDKDPSSTIPPNLKGTVATDIVQDQTASIHPFGAFLVPPLADAAGVYHTNPKPVYIPDDPRLGIYAPLFAERIALFEERPNNDMSHQPSFGRSKDVVSTGKFYREINNDNDHRIDHRAFARARLFDMLLSDWDRHKDQWRWASFEPYELDPSLEGEARTQGKIYRPIPRDRDFAFNKMDGLFPTLARRFNPKFQDFGESYGNIAGLTFNGLSQDRRLLSPLERQDFIEIADSIRAGLTDAAIDAAVRQWPEAIYQRDGAEIAHLLKIRRDKLTNVAEKYYAMHARIVDVVGSHKHERFEVTRIDKDSTRVRVFKTTQEGVLRRPLYDRVFLEEETDEIRLYGFDGDDTFIVDGEVSEGILVRAIGGAGTDSFTDHSRVRGGKHTWFYDTQTGTDWDAGPETKDARSANNPAINVYDPRSYKHDEKRPALFFGHNDDDGLFVGGGLTLIRHGFRKAPYATMHTAKANIAAKTGAFNAVYEGHYVDVLGQWDVLLETAYFNAKNIRNFFGLGNETRNEPNVRAFYQARLRRAYVAPSLYKKLDQGAILRFGPTLRLTDVEETEGRFVNQAQAGITENTFDAQVFAGLDAEVVLDTRDSNFNPRLGFVWSNEATLNVGLHNSGDTFLRLSTDLAYYISPLLHSPQITLAARLGAAHNVSDFPFYRANTLGGNNNLRGYRSTRFAGRTSFYQNVEVRLGLLSFSTYLALGRAGVMGFLDNGRVWTEADDAKDVSQSFFSGYHQGYGGGLWFELFQAFVLNAYAGFSDEDTTVTVKFNFQY